jgi:hypothetical protein|tara:strand:- start:519 stop:767 length:249 start_codon:yes stop_codon:yes gene_type:complete
VKIPYFNIKNVGMMNWDEVLEFINSPENDGKDYAPLICKILRSISNEALIKLLFKAEEEDLSSIKPYIKKEIERRNSSFPKS